MWREGTFEDYRWCAKIYDRPSTFGIDEGRISKLTIIDRKTETVLYNYDRAHEFDDLPSVPALEKVEPRKIKGGLEMIRQKLNTPEVSSCGRLFDAVSFIAGLAPLQAEYEAEAPMRLEAEADSGVQENYPFEFSQGGEQIPYQVCFHTTIRAIVRDIKRGMPASVVSSRFHNTLAEVISRAASQAQADHGLDIVVLSGGVFLNRTLLEKAQDLLEAKNFRVLRPEVYSPNDESISVGQIAYALNQLRRRRNSK